MKYCLWSRLSKQYLEKVNEIIVNYRDNDIIFDYIKDYPDKNLILKLNNDDLDWIKIESLNKLSNGRLIACVRHLRDVHMCHKIGLPFYWEYEAYSFQELNELKNLGVCYIKVSGMLFFDLENVQRYGIPIRVNPCLINPIEDEEDKSKFYAYPWIRPEDIETYEKYVDVIEFEETDIRRAEALYRVYAERRKWPGPLGMLVANSDFTAVNRLIHPEVASCRLSCRQDCLRNGICHVCERAMILANDTKVRDYLRDNDYLDLLERKTI